MLYIIYCKMLFTMWLCSMLILVSKPKFGLFNSLQRIWNYNQKKQQSQTCSSPQTPSLSEANSISPQLSRCPTMHLKMEIQKGTCGTDVIFSPLNLCRHITSISYVMLTGQTFRETQPCMLKTPPLYPITPSDETTDHSSHRWGMINVVNYGSVVFNFFVQNKHMLSL